MPPMVHSAMIAHGTMLLQVYGPKHGIEIAPYCQYVIPTVQHWLDVYPETLHSRANTAGSEDHADTPHRTQRPLSGCRATGKAHVRYAGL
jgi:hypothetical protein